MNQAIGQAFINHAPIIANFVYNAVLKTLQDGVLLGFVGPAYQQASQMVFAPTGSSTATPPIDPQAQVEGHTADWYDSIISVCSYVYQLHANGYTCIGKLHDGVPSWMESCYWLWYASRVHDVICSRATKLIGFSADESTS